MTEILAAHEGTEVSFNPPVFMDGTDGMGEESLREVIGLTQRIRINVTIMQNCAAEMCISMKLLRDQFDKLAPIDGSGRRSGGWQAFCERNFVPVGLTLGHIRSAVKSGEMLILQRNEDYEGYEALKNNLSKSALFALGHTSPEVVGEVIDLIKEDPERKVTLQEIKDLKQQQQAMKESLDAVNAQLQRSQQQVMDMSTLLDAKSTEIINLRDQNEELQQRAKTPVESIEHRLPPGVQTEQEALDSIRSEKTETEKKLGTLRQEITNVERKLADRRIAADVLSDLDSDISNMLHKYSAALIIKVSEANQSVRPALTEIAQKLRALAANIEA